MSAHVSAASLIAAGLLDASRLSEIAPKQSVVRPRRTIRQRLSRAS